MSRSGKGIRQLKYILLSMSYLFTFMPYVFFFFKEWEWGKTFQVQCLKRARKKTPATTFLLKSNHFKKRKPQQEATLVKQRHSLSLLLGERRLHLLLQFIKILPNEA